MVVGLLTTSLGCAAGNLSPRTALVAPITLSNGAEFNAKFVTRIDGEFWIWIKYVRNFHISADPILTEFSLNYEVIQNGKIVQKDNVPSHSDVSAGLGRPYYMPMVGKFVAVKNGQYEIFLKLGNDLPKTLPRSGTVAIFLDSRVPYSLFRGW